MTQPSSTSTPRHYKVIRTKNNEVILCEMDRDVKNVTSETHLVIRRPLLASVIGTITNKINRSTFMQMYALSPLLYASSDEELVLDTFMVMTIGTMTEEMKTAFLDFHLEQPKIKKHIEDRDFLQFTELKVSELLQSLSTDGQVHFISEDDVHE